jgi:2-hydroxy-3-keto-5-methylthiopentenyl-1-phosphate phosphatase
MSSRARRPSGKSHLTTRRYYRNEGINTSPSRDSFREMMDSITRPFPECVDYLVENITLDPHFNEYFQWALAHNIPTVVVSSGMTPVIRGILQKLVGPDCDKIDIICNEAVPRGDKTIDQEGGWQIQYHDDR